MENLYNNLEQLEGNPANNQVIVLKSVFKTGKTTVNPVKDSTGWYRGIPRLSEEDKRKLKVYATPESRFTLYDGVTFDLAREDQRVTWEWVKYAPCIAPTQEAVQHTRGAEFYPFIEDKAAEEAVATKLVKYKATNYIVQDNPINYAARALLLGVNMKHMKPIVIQEFLLDIAETDPGRILEVYESQEMSTKLMFLKAIEKNVIIRDGQTYRFGNSILGMTEKSCVAWLRDSKHKHLVEAIENELAANTLEINDPTIVDVDPETGEKVETPLEKARRIKAERQAEEKAMGNVKKKKK